MKKIEKYSEVSSLWLEYKSGIKYYIYKKLKSENLASELSHQILMKVYNSCCSGNEIKNIRSWMFQIAHNTVVDYLKKENRYTNEIIDILDTEEINAYKEAAELVSPLLKLLPEKYSLPLQMSDIDGLKQFEVSKKINLSLTATKSRIQRARVLLKEKIIDCCILDINDKGNLVSIAIKSDCKPLQETLKKNNE